MQLPSSEIVTPSTVTSVMGRRMTLATSSVEEDRDLELLRLRVDWNVSPVERDLGRDRRDLRRPEVEAREAEALTERRRWAAARRR